MIITVSEQTTNEERAQLTALLGRITGSHRPITSTNMQEREVIVLDNHLLTEQAQHELRQQRAVERLTSIKTSYQLVSRVFQPEDTCISVGNTHRCNVVRIGGNTNGVASSPVMIAGPCAVEDREQLLSTARAVKEAGANILRGGAFKPRTSPYQFQGLGIEGLRLLSEARSETGLPIVTEVMEPAMVDTVAQYADMLQIGSRNMQNFPLLHAVGRHPQRPPVLLKRGLAATLEEWLLAAEYIIAAGNPNVILCERGIRSYDSQTRNVLDLSCVPLLQTLTHLPVIVDPSHGTGRSELVPAMSRASIAVGAAGLIIEVHIDPDHALCDGRQSITPEQLQKIVYETQAVTGSIGAAQNASSLENERADLRVKQYVQV